ncbi:MAG: ABC transporter permease [Deltaproteobacteria bacterium]|nr:MAG: ABC transporter permease [Deltaproteobacteria bacterium]PIE72654.1 MAG: ABC transporter permease [Deltaproteobacteria bacterium]
MILRKISFKTALSEAFCDIREGLTQYSLAAMLGWQDIRQRYRRSALGPFWLTISMGVMIGTIGVVFGQLFASPMREFLPFLTIGLVLWGFIATAVGEACLVFIHSEGIIKQLPLPLFLHLMRMMWRNIIIFCHNILILPLVFLFFGLDFPRTVLLSIPGFVILVMNLLWISLLLGVICSRFRDLYQIVMSLLQIVFYVTPILWMPHLVPKRVGSYLIGINPVYHVMEIVRSPLLGKMPSMLNWEVSLALMVLGWLGAMFLYGSYRQRIAYWL